MYIRRAAVAALLAATTATAAAGCSSGTEPAAAKPTPASKSPTAASTTATASAKATSSSGLAFGTGHHWTDTDLDGSPVAGTTTVIAYTQPAKVNLPDDAADFPNPEWATLEVKVCADPTSSKAQTSQGPWNLGFPDDTRIAAPGISGGGVPKPEYPVDGALLNPGECLRGKITFSVAKGTRPDRIIYAVDGRDPVAWTVPKA